MHQSDPADKAVRYVLTMADQQEQVDHVKRFIDLLDADLSTVPAAVESFQHILANDKVATLMEGVKLKGILLLAWSLCPSTRVCARASRVDLYRS